MNGVRSTSRRRPLRQSDTPRASTSGILCRDLMRTDVRTCRPTDTVSRCTKVMLQEDVGFVPIVDAVGRPIGVVTDRDIALRVFASKRTSRSHVASIMSESPISCRVDDTLQSAEAKLARCGESRIVVVDGKGRIAGIISLSDIALAEAPSRAGRLLKAIVQRRISEAKERVGARASAPPRSEPPRAARAHERQELEAARTIADTQVCGSVWDAARVNEIDRTLEH